MKKLVLLIVIIVLAAVLLVGYSVNVNSSLSQNIVRLHVIANSDSDEDQILKLKVRDAVLKYTSSNNITKESTDLYLNEYKKIAEDTVKSNNADYPVNVEYGNFYLPTKHYKNFSLPAGNYDAVKITIGEGKGKNWWCVLFPPLCFVNGTTDSTKATAEMKKMLSRGEYDLITKAKNDGRIPVNIKFKIIEICTSLNKHKEIYAKAE